MGGKETLEESPKIGKENIVDYSGLIIVDFCNPKKNLNFENKEIIHLYFSSLNEFIKGKRNRM